MNNSIDFTLETYEETTDNQPRSLPRQKKSFKINDSKNFEDDESYGPDYGKRCQRAFSHLGFNCRPEFVPKSKPKDTDVSPTPMILVKKASFNISKNETFYYPSQGEESNSEETNEFSNYSKNEGGRLSDTRKEMIKFKNTYQRTSNASSKDTDSLSLVYRDITDLHKKYHFCTDSEQKKKKSKSIFAKVIKRFFKDDPLEDNYCKYDRNTVNTTKAFSILNILEQSAEVNNQNDFIKCRNTLN